ncbi:hypothetical protein KPL70_007034 [Citrus sinensis]|nr:hypothetical protein KPL70_007034 [Citrus sinensis]
MNDFVTVIRGSRLVGPIPSGIASPVESTDLYFFFFFFCHEFSCGDLIFNKPNGVIPSKFSVILFRYLIGNLLSGAIPADWMVSKSVNETNHWSLHINCCGKQVIADGNTTFEDDSDAAGASKLAPLGNLELKDFDISWAGKGTTTIPYIQEFIVLFYQLFLFTFLINPVISSIELKGLDLHTGSFHLRQIKAATNNFASENEISEGGFGPVYRGLLADGKVIEVKQLSSKSKQGNREIVNEIGMISALQHPNLVKLYRLCTETLKQPMCFLIRT